MPAAPGESGYALLAIPGKSGHALPRAAIGANIRENGPYPSTGAGKSANIGAGTAGANNSTIGLAAAIGAGGHTSIRDHEKDTEADTKRDAGDKDGRVR